MMTGELIFTSATAVNTPTQRRSGSKAVFVVEVLQTAGTSPTLDIAIKQKNSADTTWTTAASFTQITTAGIYTKDASSLKEEIRLEYTAGGTNAWMRVITYDPVWES